MKLPEWIYRDSSGHYYNWITGEGIYIETEKDARKVVRAFKRNDPLKDIAQQDDSEALANDLGFSWESFAEVKGIGVKTIEKIKEFCNSDDPFGVFKVKRTLDKVRNAIQDGELYCNVPTHISIDIPPEREEVVYMGIVRGKKYYDAVEQLQKRTTEELSYEEALEQLDDPHLLKYVAIDLEDEYNEPVRVRVSRWKYPEIQSEITHLSVDKDVVIVKGYSSDFGGVSIQAKEITVIEV